MNTLHRQDNVSGRGFTIIEVVLVLAIAALIFLMVFIALPALQRSQRDVARKNDLNRVQSSITTYQSNSRGALPTDWTTGASSFPTRYLRVNGESFSDPNGTDYTFTSRVGTTAAPAFVDGTAVIYYTIGGVCSDDGSTTTTGAGSRKIAFRLPLEGGGTACVNN